MHNQLLSYLQNIFIQLEKISGLKVEDKSLLNISDSKIISPIGDVLPWLQRFNSPLQNQFVHPSVLERLLRALADKQALVRINHIGFCYKVENLDEEKKRLLSLAEKTQFKFYEEPSDDAGLWLFLGNLDKIDSTVLEFVPVTQSDDRWVEYWLPHVQIDLDTVLSSKQIEELVIGACGNQIKPYAVKIEGVTYIIRCRLGVIDGVNINLDLATNQRNVEFLRKQIWQRIK